MSLCKDNDSLLIPYTDALLLFIFELRETGMPVLTKMALMKAAQICHDFCEKTRESQVSITKWFVKVHCMVHQIGTHLSIESRFTSPAGHPDVTGITQVSYSTSHRQLPSMPAEESCLTKTPITTKPVVRTN